jgi:hypothetical protein
MPEEANFFQERLYPLFYDPAAEKQSSSSGKDAARQLIDDLGIRFFLFVPIFIGYGDSDDDGSNLNWAGMLQVRFQVDPETTHEENKDRDYQFEPSLLENEQALVLLRRIAKTCQCLSSDMMIAFVEESFDVEFTDAEHLRKFITNAKMSIPKLIGIRESGPVYEQLIRMLEFEGQRAKVTLDKGLSEGELRERKSFAHQTAKSIDSIVASFDRARGDAIRALGADTLAKLYLVQNVVHTYEGKASTHQGEFNYPWAQNDSPLDVYRDISISLGLARCESDVDSNVYNAGYVAKGRQIGGKGFDEYQKQYFDDLPTTDPLIAGVLKDSSVAVLMILSLSQAVYHTVRAQLRGNPSRVTVRISSDSPDILRITIENPDLDGPQTSKDEMQLADLARRMSAALNAPAEYETLGPEFRAAPPRWLTAVNVKINKASRVSQ